MKIIQCEGRFYLRTYENIVTERFTRGGKELKEPDYIDYKDVLIYTIDPCVRKEDPSIIDLGIFGYKNTFIASFTLYHIKDINRYLDTREEVDIEDLNLREGEIK